MKRFLSCFAAVFLAAPAQADRVDDFVVSNLLAILYHEIGHATIDLMGLPVFGQEEDAADVASILLIDQLYQEEDAVALAYDSAFGFLADADSAGTDVAYWDVHGPDLQRYYTLVCLFVGADMDARYDIAADLGLPAERLDSCEDEFALAYDSWNPVFEELADAAPGQSLVYIGGEDSLTEQIVSQEVAALNADFSWPYQLTVRVEDCGEANAFYDPAGPEIIMCSEFEDWLRTAAP